MEIEEVRAAHPEIECILFPKSDYAAGLAFLQRLRDLFGKARLSEEDSYRLASIRLGQDFAHTNGAGSAEQFLAAAEATITLEYNPPSADKRVVELVNKTNQFNLNGIRYSDTEWHQLLQDERVFVLAVSYADKFGPLGKVAVLRGKQDGSRLSVGTWVLSCRAFSRRIEYQCLAQLFRRFGAEEIVFEFLPTQKNGPLQTFLASLSNGVLSPEVHVRHPAFEANCPRLYHHVIEKE